MNESRLGTIHLRIVIFQYWHNPDLQHTLSLPSSPKHRPDHFTTTLSQLRKRRAGRRFVSVSAPLASGVLASKVSEFTQAPPYTAAVGPVQKRRAKQAKTGGVTITWESQYAEELDMKRCHTCHNLSLPKTPHQVKTLVHQNSIKVRKDSHPTAHR